MADWFTKTETFVDGEDTSASRFNTNFDEIEVALNAAMPSGAIIMWSGSVATIPTSFWLCDGSNGTPDLRGRFIVGAGGAYNPADSGGSATIDTRHVHTGPNHRHYCDWVINAWRDGNDFDDSVEDGDDKTPAGSDHQHRVKQYTGYEGTGNTGSAGEAAQDNRPPYYALCFIQKK
jgi:hypothetical protein